MRGSLRFVVTVLLLVAAGIALVPATWLDRLLVERTGGRARLADAEGFWWRGRGIVTSADGAARMPIAWRVDFLPLLTGMLAVELVAADEGAMPSGVLALRDETVTVHALHARLPAAMLSALAPARSAIVLGGDVDIRAPSFAWNGSKSTGAFDTRWQRARIVVGALAVDLGVVSASGTSQGTGLDGVIRNTGGDVAVEGTIAGRDGAFEASLDVKATDHASDALRAVLPLLGASDGAGGARVTWRSAH